MNKKIIIPALVLIIVGVLGILATAKDYFSYSSTSGEKTFLEDEIDSLSIDSNVANIHIQPSTTDELTVEWKGRQFGIDELGLDVYVEGDQLNIDLGKKSITNLFRFRFGFNFNRFDLDVYLPEKRYEYIEVNNKVGVTTITSLQVEDLIVESDIADNTIEDTDAQSINATSSVGAITLKQIEGELKAKNDVGEIDVIANDVHDDMTLTSNVGNIKVKVPQKFEDISFYGSSDVGSVNIFGSKKSHISDDPSHVVYMETDVGGIDVVVDD